ncbi:hypothetical protein HDZ31DRAFT_76090 [Schizophyllum fasciatum]
MTCDSLLGLFHARQALWTGLDWDSATRGGIAMILKFMEDQNNRSAAMDLFLGLDSDSNSLATIESIIAEKEGLAHRVKVLELDLLALRAQLAEQIDKADEPVRLTFGVLGTEPETLEASASGRAGALGYKVLMMDMWVLAEGGRLRQLVASGDGTWIIADDANTDPARPPSALAVVSGMTISPVTAIAVGTAPPAPATPPRRRSAHPPTPVSRSRTTPSASSTHSTSSAARPVAGLGQAQADWACNAIDAPEGIQDGSAAVKKIKGSRPSQNGKQIWLP